MGMESFGKKAKNAIRAAVLGSSVVAGAAATEGALDINKAEAQTYTQQSNGNNSPNIIGSGNVVNRGGSEIVTPGGNIVRMPGMGKPNIVTNPDGSIRQESRGDNSPNIIERKFRQ